MNATAKSIPKCSCTSPYSWSVGYRFQGSGFIRDTPTEASTRKEPVPSASSHILHLNQHPQPLSYIFSLQAALHHSKKYSSLGTAVGWEHCTSLTDVQVSVTHAIRAASIDQCGEHCIPCCKSHHTREKSTAGARKTRGHYQLHHLFQRDGVV